ncbi:MAG TPA: hypothetical protein VLT90_09210 [Terriglobales bacterium]|nr:hypothetical protein [Terriglobales bacterium]
MRNLGLCLVFFVLIGVSKAISQDLSQPQPSKPSILNPDKKAFGEWVQRLPKAGSFPIRGYRLWTASDSESTCATMRTYRVEREAPDSDVVGPSGYSTCVSMSKFRVQDAVMPLAEPGPAE